MSRAHQEYELEGEFEGEYEGELEGEFEGEEFLGTLGRIAGGLFGGQGEGEFEGEFELEGEYEGEYESEEFLRRIAGLARRAVRSPALRRIGLTAARTALRGLGDVAGAVGGAPGSTGAQIGQSLGSQAAGLLGGLLPQSEFEFEGEYEFEGEGEMNPQRRLYNEALMEHLGHAAAEAESEAEAEAFIGALVPLAARVIPRIAPAVMRAAPGLIRGAANVARTLRRSPATRPLVRAIPTIVRRTAAGMARQAAAGRPVTSQAAVRTLAQQTAQVIGNPRQCAGALQRSRTVDRNFHRATGQRTARPTCAGCAARRVGAARTNGHGAPCAACGAAR